MKRYRTLIILLFTVVFISRITAQDEKGPLTTTMSFTCTSTSDDSIQLKVQLGVRHEEGATNLANAPVVFSVTAGETILPAGTAKTNFQGIAILKIPVKNDFPKNEEQMIQFKAAFEGTEKYEAAEGEFALRPAKLSVSFYEEDSVKYIKVDGIQYHSDGTGSPLGPADLVLLVPKMFSNLKIGEVSLDSTGTGTTEFPLDIIGDSLGNLVVIAALDEHETFGNVRGQAVSTWALRKHLISPDRPSRELWTPIAPLWMIITLIIMLAGVWGHYIYAIIQLVMIRRSGKAAEEKEEEATP